MNQFISVFESCISQSISVKFANLQFRATARASQNTHQKLKRRF